MHRHRVDPRRSPVALRLMKPRVIVKDEVPAQTTTQLRGVLVALNVNVFVLHRPPQTFDEDVVQRPAPAVHAHRHPGRLQPARDRLGRELRLWSVLNTSGRPRLKASSSISRQNEPSSVFDNRQANT